MKKLLSHIIQKDIKKNKYLKSIIAYFDNYSLWYFNRKSISKAFAIGLFCAFLPIPFQMIPAAFLAILFSANLPLSVSLVWISNPITVAPIFYGCYKLGAFILNFAVEEKFTISFAHLWQTMQLTWQPFLLGCFIIATFSSLLGYYGIQAIYNLKIYRRKKHTH